MTINSLKKPNVKNKKYCIRNFSRVSSTSYGLSVIEKYYLWELYVNPTELL